MSRWAQQIDWREVVFDLHRAGLSMGQIAASCGYRHPTRQAPDDGGKSWVHRLKNIPDSQPTFHHGALLIGLWVQKTGRPVAELPRAPFRYVDKGAGRITALPLVDQPLFAVSTASAAVVADAVIERQRIQSKQMSRAAMKRRELEALGQQALIPDSPLEPPSGRIRPAESSHAAAA